MNEGQIHWEGCWHDHKHHSCAVGRIKQLEAAIDSLALRHERLWKAERSGLTRLRQEIEQIRHADFSGPDEGDSSDSRPTVRAKRSS